EAQIIDDAHPLVTVLGQPGGLTHHEAQQDLAEAARDTAWIERRERRQEMLGRTERVVLVTVLDVRDTVAIEEPGAVLDSRGDLARTERATGSLGVAPSASDERARQLLANVVPVELEIVVAVNDRQRVTIGHEARERLEHLVVTGEDGAQLRERVIT